MFLYLALLNFQSHPGRGGVTGSFLVPTTAIKFLTLYLHNMILNKRTLWHPVIPHFKLYNIIQWHAVSCNEHAVFCEFPAYGLLESTHARCWNLHIQCECSVHGLLKSMHTLWQELKSTHHMIIKVNLGWIWTQNVGCHCIIVIKHGLQPVDSLTGLRQCMPTHALFHKTQATHV